MFATAEASPPSPPSPCQQTTTAVIKGRQQVEEEGAFSAAACCIKMMPFLPSIIIVTENTWKKSQFILLTVWRHIEETCLSSFLRHAQKRGHGG